MEAPENEKPAARQAAGLSKIRKPASGLPQNQYKGPDQAIFAKWMKRQGM
jgi:hypothetical protein